MAICGNANTARISPGLGRVGFDLDTGAVHVPRPCAVYAFGLSARPPECIWECVHSC